MFGWSKKKSSSTSSVIAASSTDANGNSNNAAPIDEFDPSAAAAAAASAAVVSTAAAAASNALDPSMFATGAGVLLIQMGAEASNGDNGASSAPGTHSYREHFLHQYQHVSNQCGQGLLVVKRTAAGFERFSENQLEACEAFQRAVKAWREKYAAVSDECTMYATAVQMIDEVLMLTDKARELLAKSLRSDIVEPMRAWHRTNTARRTEADKHVLKLHTALKTQVVEVSKERADCQRSYNELKIAADEKRREEHAPTKEGAKVDQRWRKLKETTARKFQAFEQHLEQVRAAQQAFYQTELPAKLAEMEQIERERLQHVEENANKFLQLFAAFAMSLRQSSQMMAKALPVLNVNRAMTSMIDKWVTQFGLPPTVMQVPYDLPCHWSDIERDQLDMNSSGHLVAKVVVAGFDPNAAPTTPHQQTPQPQQQYHPPPPQPQQSQPPPPAPSQAQMLRQASTSQIKNANVPVSSFSSSASPTHTAQMQTPSHHSSGSSSSSFRSFSTTQAGADTNPFASIEGFSVGVTTTMTTTPSRAQQQLSGSSSASSRAPAAANPFGDEFEEEAPVRRNSNTGGGRTSLGGASSAATAATQSSSRRHSMDGEPGSTPAAAAETVQFMAQALFDFQLAPDGDIQYIRLRAGDRVGVIQTGDEWWYGTVNGQSGFFPSNYVKRLA